VVPAEGESFLLSPGLFSECTLLIWFI